MYNNTLNYEEQGGGEWHIGGLLIIDTGGSIIATGGAQATLSNLTDNTGGTASTTLAAIAAGSSYAQADMVAVKNALASVTAQLNATITALKALGIST
ncbi:hypothetical protein [Fimbriiglobus ruber]|uniref:Uncharacterized protein n=1 Tax=Fimbriiglobus ruber TaxID=1908690 RepID=A0A225D0C6_9BACT|nr:hypothetical protein [Fimbriiglobus ruber]OWK34962.1 hypothetical protein FRUB_09804 [Fimbriiglobus ruber]